MKKEHAILIGIILLGVCMFWWLGRNKRTPEAQLAEAVAGQTNKTDRRKSPSVSKLQEKQQPQTQQNATMSASDLEAFRQKVIAEQTATNKVFEEKWKEQWDTPINFYGKVVDEAEVPLPIASAEFQWTNVEGVAAHASATSDSSGLFFLTGVRSRGLTVRVAKDGYYASAKLNQTYFLYADVTGRGTFTPDPSSPVTFHLRKKGPGTDLITSQYGVFQSLEAKIPRDGTSVQIDFLNRKVAAGGQLTISQTKPAYENWKQATTWTFRVEIPDGGFVQHDDEFPFYAPESGYESVLQFTFQSGQANWTTNLRKDYYIKFGNPPRYGRLHLETDIMWGGARLTYAINPDGSRYLEPK